MEDKNLQHVGVLGMRWGRRQGPKPTSVQRIKAKSAAGLKKDRAKIAELKAKTRANNLRKLSKKKLNAAKDENFKSWSTGKKVAVVGLAAVGWYGVLKFVSEGGPAKLMMKAAGY